MSYHTFSIYMLDLVKNIQRSHIWKQVFAIWKRDARLHIAEVKGRDSHVIQTPT